MVTKADLHRLIDELPDAVLPAAERSLAALEAAQAALPVSLRTIPFDDLEPDEMAALAELDVTEPRISHAEMKRELGL